MLDFIKKIWKNHFVEIVLAFSVIMLLFSIGLCLYAKHLTGIKEIQTVSQEVAETPTGVKIAAEKSGHRLDDEQVVVVAEKIKEIRENNKKPDYSITTTPQMAQKLSEQARKDNKADIAIVTNPAKPTEAIDLSKIEPDKTVELNQYNIKCYKPVLRTVEYGTDKALTFTISKKVNDNGNYVGVGVGYDFNNKKPLIKLSYSW